MPLDELVPEAEAPDPHREDEHLPAQCAWDASGDARQDATDAADLRQAPEDAGAGKLAALALDDRARDASSPQERQSVPRAQPDAAAELCTPDAALSAARSCAAPEEAADLRAQPDAAVPLEPEAQLMP